MSPTHGEQENSVWNGHYACTCYHPLFVFNQSVIWNAARCVLAMSTAPTAGRMCSTRSCNAIEARSHASIFEQMQPPPCREFYDCLEAERVKYAIRIPTYQVLQNRIGYLLKRPVGRPPNKVRRY